MSLVHKIKSRFIRFKKPKIDKLISQGLTYLKPADLLEMEDALLNIKNNGVKGIYL